MDDLISRQAAIDSLEQDEKYNEDIPLRADGVRDAIITISSLPSAQPERKKGKWIEQDDGWYGTYYECSVCKEPFTLIDGTPQDNLYNFCPNCGADMRGGKENAKRI